MKTLNAQLRDAALLHLVDLQRFANTQVREMLALLAKTDVKLFERIAIALSKLPIDSFTVRRLDALLGGVWTANEGAYRQLGTRMAVDMRELSAVELGNSERLFTELLPKGAEVASPNLDAVWAATKAEPFRGRLLGEWFASLGVQRQQRISDSLRIGYTTGATIGEMITSLRGTRAQNYADGLLNIDRAHAETIVRTATSHTAAFARSEFYAENADLISIEQWVSTLDNRTSEECMARDGRTYTSPDHEPIDHEFEWGEGPGAIHFNCRSVSVPVVDLASRLGIKLPEFDRAAQGGTVPASTSYGEWLGGISAEQQDRILGPTRARDFRSGKVGFDKFFNDKGKFLTLEEMRAR